MNYTAIVITLVICATLVIIYRMSKGGGKK